MHFILDSKNQNLIIVCCATSKNSYCIGCFFFLFLWYLKKKKTDKSHLMEKGSIWAHSSNYNSSRQGIRELGNLKQLFALRPQSEVPRSTQKQTHPLKCSVCSLHLSTVQIPLPGVGLPISVHMTNGTLQTFPESSLNLGRHSQVCSEVRILVSIVNHQY